MRFAQGTLFNNRPNCDLQHIPVIAAKACSIVRTPGRLPVPGFYDTRLCVGAAVDATRSGPFRFTCLGRAFKRPDVVLVLYRHKGAQTGSLFGPISTKSLYMTGTRFTPSPSSMNLFSDDLLCTNTTSASPRRPVSSVFERLCNVLQIPDAGDQGQIGDLHIAGRPLWHSSRRTQDLAQGHRHRYREE